MSPPGGTTGKGQGAWGALPPKDFYSPKACANCHGDSSASGNASLGAFTYEPLNPTGQKFLPSPSDCPAEIYWPDQLKTYQEFVQINPYLKGQNYLDTLLLSRQGTFPLEVHDTSLDVYLGLKGPTSFPKFKLEIPHSAEICAGPAQAGGKGFEACEGLEIELKDEDIGLTLEGLDLISASNLDLGILGPIGSFGIKVKNASVREGRLLVSLQLGNSLFNAGFPLLFTDEELLKKLNPTVQKILRSAAPNPYDPDLYDIDVTSLILEKIPVAYRVANGAPVNYTEYQAETDKLGLKTLPYFFNMAREGKFPSRISFNQLYETVAEYRKNVRPSEKKQDEEQKALLQKLLETIAVRARLHPGRLLFKNLYVEFSDEPGKNLIETQLTLKNLQDANLVLTAPLQIDRLYSPGGIDITQLKGDLGLVYHSSGESEFRLDNLELELGRMEYGGTQEKGPPGLVGLFGKLQRHFSFDPTKPGKVAILGGRLTAIPDIMNNAFTALPALRVQGDPVMGFKVESNLRMEGVRLRLPMLGEVTVYGNIEAKLRLVPKIEVETLPDGNTQQKTSWVPDPHSLHLRLSDLDISTSKGKHWTKATIEVYDDGLLMPSAYSAPGIVAAKIDIPEMTGGNYTSLRIDGGISVPKGSDGLYDFQELAKGFATELTLHAIRLGGNPEDWSLNVSGSHQPDATNILASIDSRETDPSGTVKRRPVEDLQIKFARALVGDRTSFLIQAKAKKVDFPLLQLSGPELELEATQEATKNGGSFYTVPTLDFKANPWKSMPKAGLIRGPLWVRLVNTKKKPLSIEIDGASPTFEIKNLNLDFGVQGVTHEKLVKSTGGRITGVDIDGALRGFWKMDYDAFKGKGMLTLAGDAGGEGDIHLRGADFLRLVKDDPRDPTRLVEIPIFSKTTWTVWNILGLDSGKERINGAFQLSTKVDPAFARVFDVIIDNGKVMNWMMTHDHLPYTAKGYVKKMEEYVAAKAMEERKAEEARKAAEGKKP